MYEVHWRQWYGPVPSVPCIDRLSAPCFLPDIPRLFASVPLWYKVNGLHAPHRHVPIYIGDERSLPVSCRLGSSPRSDARFYHIADAHNMVDEPVASARAFGDIDFLVLNGDLPNHSGDINNFTTIHRIAAEITSGEKPVVFSRGNHDLRGI